MIERPKNNRRLPSKLLNIGAQALGTIAGISAEYALPSGGILGATTAAAVSETLASVGEEIEKRALAPMEQERIGEAYFLIATKIQSRMDTNEQPRDDGFWECDAQGLNTSVELLEGVLLSARDSYERRKIPLLASLYSGIAFDSSISRFNANHLLHMADQMTYMEFVALSILSDENQRIALAAPHAYPLDPEHDLGRKPPATPDSTTLIAIIFGLFSKGLVMGHRGDPAWGSISAINPRRVQLSWSGFEIMRLAELDQIPVRDQEIFTRNLQRTLQDTDPNDI